MKKKTKILLIESIFWLACLLISIKLIRDCSSTPTNLEPIVWFCLLGTIVGSIFLVFWYVKSDIFDNFVDYRRTLLVLLILFLSIIWIVDNEILVERDTNKHFWSAKIEWFLSLVSIIGIIGAVWAIIAKMEASRAFQAAKDAQRSIAGIIDFREILIPVGEKAEVPMLPQLVDSAEQELIMVLGVPAVGFFDKKLRSYSMDFLEKLNKKLEDLKDNECVEKIRILYLSRAKLNELLDRKGKDGISNFDKSDLNIALNKFELRIEELKNKMPKKIKVQAYDIDPGLRFVISLSKTVGKIFEDRALVWVVSNFDDDSPSKFKSAGFTTRDRNVIKNLKQLADDYIETKRLVKT